MLWSGFSLSVRFQPGTSLNENGITPGGTCSSIRRVESSPSFGTSTVHSTGSSGAASVGRTWMWAPATAAVLISTAAIVTTAASSRFTCGA